MKNNILKSIFVTILLLLGVSHTAWGRTIYLDTSGASSPYNSTNWWAHIWDGGSEDNKALTKVKDNLYEVEVGTCAKIIFVPNSETGKTWTNQTDNITIPDPKEDKNCYKITGKSTGSWVNYQKFSIEGITKSETESDYAIHMWGSGVTATDFKFYKTNNKNYYLVTNKSGWDMSSWTGFGFKKGTDWKGGGGVAISATNTWAENVYATGDGTLPNSGTVYAIYFYYDGSSTSALYLSTTPYPTIEWTTAPANGTVGGSMTATVSTNQTSPTVTWTSSNTSVATIDANGVITYKAAGTTTITASYTGDGSTYCAEKASVSKEITVTAAAKWQIKGSWDNWAVHDFTDNGDNTCSWPTKLVENTVYQFVIFQEGTYYKGGTINSKSNQNISLATSGNDNSITPSTSGTYTFIWNYNTKTLSVTYPAITTYTVTIATNDANYGSVSPSEVANVASGTSISASGDNLTIGNTTVTATPTTQTDQYTYSFTNWTAIPNDGKVTDNITVTANFSRAYRTYTITYNLNEGTWDGVAGASSYTYGTGLPLLPTNIQRTGYTFDGWYTSENFSGDAVTSISNTEKSNITLYAKWTKDYSKDTYYYFDERVTGWNPTQEKPEPGEVMVNAEEYAYIKRPAYNDTDNKFKIFPDNPKKADNTKIADGENIPTEDSPLKGNIKLTAEGGTYNNILMPATTSDYFVILYYPYTTINPSNNFLVAASYSLPNAETYNVSFGVVDNTGGTLTAKSGSSTIESGALVSFATFTATPAAGYSVEGWYADAEGKTKIVAAGTNTTYSQAITGANNTVYVKFAKVYAIYYKFNDQKWDDNYYAYIFTDEVWHNDKDGVQPNKNRSEYGKMTKYNDSVYYYKFIVSADYPRFAFSWGDKTGQDVFYQVSAVYRKDFDKDMPVFISQRGQAADVHNEAQYYNQGVWMRFNDTIPGYNLGLRNQTDNNANLDESYRFTAAEPGDYISTVDVALVAGKTYSFLVKNDKKYYFTPNDATNCTSSNSHFELYKSDNKKEVVITPDVTGTYTFQLNLANGKVEIDVLYPTTQYRLVYVEKDKDNDNIVKFHPSHIIKKHSEATAVALMFDTVSMHVRPKILNNSDTTKNPNTCEVWLQEFKKKEDGNGMDWETIQTIDTKDCSSITTNGVYNFIIAQGATKTSIDPKTIHPYTGRYYIRTDASDGGWNNYKQPSNYCYYTDYSRVYRGFDYYYCHWAPKANIKYTIACDYSYCVSDTLAKEDHEPHNSYTDASGTLRHNANVRFMWNSFDNTLDRAYIAGAGDNLHLLSAAGIYDTVNVNTAVRLLDQENWVYRADVKADTQARIKLRAVPYNGAKTYSWFRGKEGEITDENNTEQLIEGKAGTQYTIRVIYDFKTDHLICAWVPDGKEISDTIVVNADLMLLRENHGNAAQLKFSTNGQLKDITVAYSVINITKAHLSDEEKKLREKEIYWISFPYDVNLSDVFGCGKYGEHFIIQYYDGAARAENGCWADSPTYWKYITNPTGVVLKKGLGYVLVLDSEKILEDQFKYNNASVNIYFPSSGPIDSIDAKLPTAVEVPAHKCTIERDKRYIYDSNWNIIGIPTWANIDKFNNPMVPAQSGDPKVGFYYAHDAKNSKWTVCETSTVDFQSMYSYLVQWAGIINWKERSATGEHHPSSLAPRRYAPAAEEEGEATAPEQYTLCLTLNRGGQQLDHTYVRLQEGNVTTDFDLNYDMTKILNSGANLYSLVGTQQIQCAANVQPLQEEARTISIPLGVVADQDGLYTFSLPEGTEGMNVSIADSESGTVHNLSLGDYQTALNKGTYEGRFALEIRPRQEVTTGCEQTDAAGKHLRKVLIDGNLYILRDGKAYTAAGQEL